MVGFFHGDESHGRIRNQKHQNHKHKQRKAPKKMASSLFIFPEEKKSIISEQPKQKVNPIILHLHFFPFLRGWIYR